MGRYWQFPLASMVLGTACAISICLSSTSPLQALIPCRIHAMHERALQAQPAAASGQEGASAEGLPACDGSSPPSHNNHASQPAEDLPQQQQATQASATAPAAVAAAAGAGADPAAAASAAGAGVDPAAATAALGPGPGVWPKQQRRSANGQGDQEVWCRRRWAH